MSPSLTPIPLPEAVQPPAAPDQYLTAAFYKFVDLPDFEERKAPLLAFCEAHQVKGLILLAREGINSTIAGAAQDVHAVLAYLRSDPLLYDLQHKESFSLKAPFYRMKVRLKKEIVTLGVPGISPIHMAGTYVKPEDWNALIADPEVVVVDTRNDYEVEIGTFKHAINPNIQSFSELPDWVAQAQALQARTGRKPKVAMFCTGGIRCEKSTALMRSQGFDEVFHLEGGILKYLETVPPEKSLWQGECFVFDERVSVGHGLVPGPHTLCRCCRDPLPAGAMDSPLYEAGVSCPRCHDQTTEAQKNSARERQRQWERAKATNQAHIGAQQAAPRKAVLLPAGTPVLYSFRRCPYAMRARLALQAAGIRCELREVALKQKPEALLQASPKGTVPVLVLPGRVIEQSLDIILWALAQHDPEGWLPRDAALKADALDLVAKRHPGVLLRFGGHAMAAGCTLDEEHLATFEEALQQVAQEWLDAATLQRRLETDGPLLPEYRRHDVADRLAREVWGQGFAAPTFSEELEVLGQRLVGDKHLALKLRHQGQPVDGMWFGRVDPLPAKAHLAFRLETDEWQGKQRVRFVVEAMADASIHPSL